MKGLKGLDALTMTVLIVGGLNWLLVGLFEFDLVAWIFGGMEFGETNAGSRIIYILVGVCALYWIPRLPSLLRQVSDRDDRTSATREPSSVR